MKSRTFDDLFPSKKPLIGCVHLMPLPGSPSYDGDRKIIYEKALEEVAIFNKYKLDGLIIENFRDKPFFPDNIPAETIASLAAIGREIKREVEVPLGINALRNDAGAALAIATSIGAEFIRVNVHVGAAVSEQGVLQGESHKTLRLRKKLKSTVLIFADVDVKHAKPLVDRGLPEETKDLTERGKADAIIVSGSRTGLEAKLEDLQVVKSNTHLPVLIGSGLTPDNISEFYSEADGFVVGSYFKEEGKAENFVDESRVKLMRERFNALKSE
ncbi:MAG: BtpA/SgcQ family protein [Thermoplasmata archaeon]|nr:MAG: BtpA/SgcQ family protein [Thermoplasmata archaeon]